MRLRRSVVSLAGVVAVAGSSLPVVVEPAVAAGPVTSSEIAPVAAPAELVPPAAAELGPRSASLVEPRRRGRPERVRELVGKRTASSSTFAMSDGTRQLVLSAAPVHYRDDEGAWRKVDTAVVPGDGAAAFVNDTNVFESAFGRSTDDLVDLDAGGYAVGLGAVGETEEVLPSAAGSTVRFADVFGSADVRYRVLSEGVKEDILLADATAVADSYVFELSTDGLTPRELRGGSIGLFADDADDPAFVLPAPFMVDASAAEETGQVSQSIVRRDGQTLLEVSPDQAWLADSGREFPVVIDPSIVVAPDPSAARDTAIYSGAPTTNYGLDSTIKVGRDSGGTWRGLLGFPLTGVPAGADVRSADLNLHYAEPHAGDNTEVEIQVRKLTKAFVENGATWNSINADFDPAAGFTTVLLDDSDTAYTTANGDWQEKPHVDAIGGSQSVLPLATGGESFDWNFRVPGPGDYQLDVHYAPGPNRGTPTYQATGDTGTSPSVGVDQTVAGTGAGGWETNVLKQHFAPGATARVKLTRQAGATETIPAADAVRLREFGTQTKGADERDEWHSFAVTNFVQNWVNGEANFGFMVKAADESITGGPAYQASEAGAFGGETRIRPQLVINYDADPDDNDPFVPGVTLDVPLTVHATGPELAWSAYNDPSPEEADNLVEYQIFRGCVTLPDDPANPDDGCAISVGEDYTPGSGTDGIDLVGTVPPDVTSWTDTSAVASTATQQAVYRYWVVARTESDTHNGQDGRSASNAQTVTIPREGRIVRVLTGAIPDTTLSKAQPNANLPKVTGVGGGAGRFWLQVGNNHADYGVERAILRFDTAAIQAVDGGPVKVTDARLELTESEGVGSGATFDLHALNRGRFVENEATWRQAQSTLPWLAEGGDFDSPELDSVSTGNVFKPVTFTGTGLRSTVQSWINDPDDNHGLLLKARNETASQQRLSFVNSESPDTLFRPRLVVEHLAKGEAETIEADQMPERFRPNTTISVPFTVTNTTDITWPAGLQLSYRWTESNDPVDITVAGERNYVDLGKALTPGEAVSHEIDIRTPINSDTGETRRLAYDLYLDLWDPAASAWYSNSDAHPLSSNTARPSQGCTMMHKKGLLCVDRFVEDARSNQLGLEDFMTYAGENTGAGSVALTNLYAGNVVWSYDAFANPSVGPASFVRLAYNSQDGTDEGAGYGVSVQPATLTRLGSQLSVPSGGSVSNLMTFIDGDGTTHTYKRPRTENGVLVYDRPAGVQLDLARDETKPDNQQWTLTRPDGTRFYFSQSTGRPTAVKDRNNNTLSYEYDAQGRLVEVCDTGTTIATVCSPPGHRVTLELGYDGDSQNLVWIKEGVTDGVTDRALKFHYNASHQLVEVEDGGDFNTSTGQYGTPAEVKSFVLGYTEESTNGNARLNHIEDPRRHTSAFTYWNSTEQPLYEGWPKTFNDRKNTGTSFDYSDPDGSDAKDLETKVTDVDGSDLSTTTYRMDGFGRTTEILDAQALADGRNDDKTRLVWDADHNVIRLTEPNGAVSTWEYDPDTGYPLEIRDAEAVTNHTESTVLTYQQITNAVNGAKMTLLRSMYTPRFAAKCRVSEIDPGCQLHSFTYDTKGNLKTVTNPLDQVTTYTYNTNGTLATVKDANDGVTEFKNYEENGYPQTIVDPLGVASTGVPDDFDTHFLYDKRGNVQQVTDPLGRVTIAAYDDFGRLTRLTEPGAGDGSRTTVTDYDLNDNVTKVTAPNGAETTSTYDVADNLDTVTLPSNGNPATRVVDYDYDLLDRLVEQTAPKGTASTSDPDDFVTRYGYDLVGQLTRVEQPFTDTDGTDKTAVTTYEYDNVGNVVQEIDPVKNAGGGTDFTTKTAYDLNHRPIAVTDAAGFTAKYEYNVDGLTTGVIDQLGNKRRMVYDPAGQLTEVHVKRTQPDDPKPVDLVTRYAYDDVGNPIQVTRPSGDFTTTVYDLNNRPTVQKGSVQGGGSRPSTYLDYDQAGQLTLVSMPTFATTKPADNDPQWTHYEYWPSGQIQKSTDPWNIVTSYGYNQLGQQESRTLSNPADTTATRTQTWDYHPDGSLAARTDQAAQQPVDLADNSDSWQTALTGTWATVTGGTNTVGTNYRTHAAAAPGSPAASDEFRWTFNPDITGSFDVYASCPVRADATTAASYTVNHATGSATAVVDQKACTSATPWKKLGTFTFTEGANKDVVLKPSTTGVVVADAMRFVATDPAPKKDYAYTYDANGQLETVTDNVTTPAPEINSYRIVYDGLGRTKTVNELKGTTTVRSTTYSYDLNSNPLTIHAQQFDVDANHEARSTFTKYKWDVRNLVDTVKTGNSPTDPESSLDTYAFTYNARGQTATVTKPNSNETTYGYYEDGLVESMMERTSKANGAELVAQHALRYTPDGDLARDFSKIDQSGTTGGFLNQTTLYDYTPNRQVGLVTRTGEEAGKDENYTYGPAGNITDQTIGGTTTQYSYDLGRLTSAEIVGSANSKVTYRYDVFGRTSATHDVNGAVLERYGYDGFDRQIWHRERNSNGVRQSAHTKTYDPFDRTTTETVQVKTDPATTTRFVYLGLTDRVAVEEEQNAAGQWDPSKTYHYGADGRPLSLHDTPVDTSTDRKLFYGWSPHGDVETLTNPAGEPAATYRYTAYGDTDPAGTTGLDAPTGDPVQDADVVNPYRYSGHRYTGLTGSYDFGFRDYDPALNRFLTRDMYMGALADLSLGLDPWNTNRYTLTGGNPITRIDLDGHINAREDGGGGHGGTPEEIADYYNIDLPDDDDDAPWYEDAVGDVGGALADGARTARDYGGGAVGGTVQLIDEAIPSCLELGSSLQMSHGAGCSTAPSYTDAYENQVREWGVDTDGWAYTLGSYVGIPTAAGGARTAVRITERIATRTGPRTATETGGDIGGVIYRTGSRTDNALTDASGVSFRDSVSSSLSSGHPQVFRRGDKIWGLDTSRLPAGSVVRDGVPPGHVSVYATPEQIRAAIVQDRLLTDLGLKPLDEFGSFRLPK